MLRDLEYGAAPQQKAAASWLEQAPKIDPDNRIYWTGFQELTTSRQLGMAVGPIPFTAIAQYTQFYPFTEEEAHRFVEVIRAIDNGYLKLVHKSKDETDK